MKKFLDGKVVAFYVLMASIAVGFVGIASFTHYPPQNSTDIDQRSVQNGEQAVTDGRPEGVATVDAAAKPVDAASLPTTATTDFGVASQAINEPKVRGGTESSADETGLEHSEAAPRAAGAGAPNQAVQGITPDGRQTRKLDPFRGPIDVRPVESRARKSGKSFSGDLRTLVSQPKKERRRFLHEKVLPSPRVFGPNARKPDTEDPASSIAPGATAPAPAPIKTFEALGRTGGWGNGYPSDTSGDVGPNHYVQAINTAMAVYDKNGNLLAGPMNLDTFMSQGNFGNLCDTANFGDPIVLYDTFEDRWIISDFAFIENGNAIANPPGSYQCIAVSRSGDPVAGGWNFYSINRTDALNDYPKLGVWPDGIYMSANMFDHGAGGFYHGVTVWALNKAQMYAGSPDVQIVSFDIGTGDFSLLPAHARLQTGTPPPGTPNYFASTWNFVNGLSVYKFHVDWNRISHSTFTGPDVPLAATSWPDESLSNATVPAGGTTLDPVEIRAMMQNTYSNIAGVESLWLPHTVRRQNTSGAAAPRWYQVNVTGGSVMPNLVQAATWDPDGNNTVHRFMPSLAVDHVGNMALGYTASSTAMHPSIKYAGRLAADPANTFSRTEQTMYAGTGSQSGTSRWGDYTHMTLDPDGCTFWYTNQYYAETGNVYRTRVGNFKFDECSVLNNGTLSGTVTSGGLPLAGAAVSLGSRSTVTDANGLYVFNNLPPGVYPFHKAEKAGYQAANISSVVIANGGTTMQDLDLITAPPDGCLPDASQSEFQSGDANNIDITPAGELRLSSSPVLDQRNIDLILSSGSSFTTGWHAQSFTPSRSGPVRRVDVHFYSADCSEVTMPNITVSIRAASGGLPTGPDLGSATIPGFCNGVSKFYTVNFATPPTLAAGTQYAIVWRTTLTLPSVNPNPRYISTLSNGNPYSAGGRSSSTNGSSWTAGNLSNNDFGFRVFIDTGFSPSGTYISEVKDANPSPNAAATWNNITWTNASMPSGTDVRFQLAASTSPNGPFNFVGGDGTSSSYFVSGSSLAQFNGYRYLRYKAFLTTSISTVTPTVNDVNVCFANQAIAACSDVSMPLQTSKTGVPLAVPVNVSNVDGLSARSADLRITYDPTVIQPAGNSANNWGVTFGAVGLSTGGGRTLTVTRPAPGTLAISVFGINDMQGAGALVNLNFNVTGVPTSSTVVAFDSFIFNEGDPCVTTSNGSVTVLSGSISGKVTFGNAGAAPSTKPVPNVTLNASGSTPRSSTSASDGTFSINGMGAGQYTLTASKAGEAGTAISGFDAADIASHVVGMSPQLTNDQMIVADVSGNGTVTSFDAAMIATYAAGLSGTGSAGTWRFVPASRVFANLHNDQTDQGFVALLMGDVTGNWSTSAPSSLAEKDFTENRDAMPISLSQIGTSPGTILSVPVTIGDTTDLGIRSFEFDLHYDANVIEPAANPASLAGTVSDGRVLTVNATEKGVIRVVAFGAAPLEGEGQLLKLHFNVIGVGDSSTELRWENFRLNEGGINFKTVNGQVNVASLADEGSINGRVLDPRGGGVARARVIITDTKGNTRAVMTSSLGYFQISELQVGETYTVRTESRRYRFTVQTVSITNGNAVELQLIGME